MILPCVLTALTLFLVGFPVFAQRSRLAAQSITTGVVRTHYIAADEADWDYAPSYGDQVHGEKYHFQDDPASRGALDPNATIYRKVLFREYSDATFRTLKLRPEQWAHLWASLDR
jgi:manganese oxidase